MKKFLLRKFRAIICYWMAVTDKWVVPETLLDGLYEDTMTLAEAREFLDKQAEFWGADDPEIKNRTHFLNLMRE